MKKLYSKKPKSDVWKFGNQPDKEMLEHLRKFYQDGVAATKARREKWKISYKYWINSMLSSRRPSYKSDLRINYCWVTTEVKLPYMTQNMPRVNFISFNPEAEGEKQAEHMSRLVGNALWHKLEVNSASEDVCWDAMVYDAGFYKIGWDPTADDDDGEIFVSSIEAFKIIPDPYTKKLQKGRYVIHIEPYSIDELKVQYPKHSQQIAPDKEISQILFEERKYAERKPTLRSGVVTESTEFETERAFKKEYWLAPRLCDLTIMEEVKEEPGAEQTDPMIKEMSKVLQIGDVSETQQPEEIRKPKYRKGRVITTINDAVVVDDKPHPYAHGKFPFVMQIMHKIGNELWGIGDIEQLIPLQDALNHAYQQLDDIIALMANLGWTADPSLGEKNLKLLAERLGIVGALKVAPLDKLRPDTPPVVPQYLIERIKDLVQRIYEITGINEIMQGSGRVTHRTARGIERLSEAGGMRIGKSTQYYEKALKEVAFQMAELSQEFYTEDRVHAIIGGNGQIAGVLKTQGGQLKGRYEATVDSGAALPRDKQSKADLVFNLADKGVFQMALSANPIEKQVAKVILDAVEFPGREELLNQKPPQAPPPPQPQSGAPGVLPPGSPPVPPVGLGMAPSAPGMQTGGAPNPLMAIMEMAAAAGIPPERFIQMLSQGAS